ncbi:acetyltransferase (GNAT) family protein [Alteromonadaceae bacterium 2753L.S.0a.02]|nr:acetyltransferase (GNAT) family protein [Alteromonadaceae bacterium 2753L.S.0a.02]
MSAFELRLANYGKPEDAKALAGLLHSYSSDEMGGAEPLPMEHCNRAAHRLQQFGSAFTVLAFDRDSDPASPVGMATCLLSFSTFLLKPIVNIHDFFVAEAARGSGVAMLLLEEVERQAKQRGCCKITLEVLSNNERAKRLYARFGFNGYELTQGAGIAQFWQKYICD